MRPDFPGMDPWLEQTALWSDLHNSLIAAIRDEITVQLPEHYYLALEERTVVSINPIEPKSFRSNLAVATRRRGDGEPIEPAVEAEGGVLVLDVELSIDGQLRETFLEIHDAWDGRLVTVIEVLSPSNKTHRRTRTDYEEKRDEILRSWTSLVEIDLLRAGEPMPLATVVEPSDYRILVARGRHRPRARYFAFGVRAAVPTIPIPLLPDDPEPTLELNRVLHALFDRARYWLRVDYGRPPVPPLAEADAAWAREIIARGR